MKTQHGQDKKWTKKQIKQTKKGICIWTNAKACSAVLWSANCKHKEETDLRFHMWSLYPSHPIIYSSVHAKSLQSCLTLCDPVDCSPPGSSIQGILQARILELVARPSSRGPSRPIDWTHVTYISHISRQVLYHLRHLGSPIYLYSPPKINMLSLMDMPGTVLKLMKFMI